MQGLGRVSKGNFNSPILTPTNPYYPLLTLERVNTCVKMGIIQEKQIYFFEEFLDFGVVAGFTDKAYSGLKVEEDVKRISSSLDFTYQKLSYLNQVHGSTVILPEAETQVFTGDGLLSDKNKEILLVRTADCLPLFFYESTKKVIGIIHLGWRPAKENIIAVFIDKLKDVFGAGLKEAFLGIGPGLRRSCFEVGREFLDFSCFAGFIEERDSKYYLDMVSFLKRSFVARGFKKENFLDSQICSFCDSNFYSARRDKTDKRTLSFIMQR